MQTKFKRALLPAFALAATGCFMYALFHAADTSSDIGPNTELYVIESGQMTVYGLKPGEYEMRTGSDDLWEVEMG